MKTRRMDHIFKSDGRSLIVAMDHGTFDGASPGIENPGRTLEQIVEGGADAVLVNFGVARKFASIFSSIGYIARLDLPPTYMGKGHDSRMYFDADYAMTMGADAVMVNVGQGAGVEETTYEHLARTISYCDSIGMPVGAEPVPGGFDADKAFRTIDHVARGARIACEIGCDFIKTVYLPGFERVIKETFVPIVMLGGRQTDDEKSFLAFIKEGLEDGVNGVAMGRNVWGTKNVVGKVKAIAALIHQNASVDEAYEILMTHN